MKIGDRSGRLVILDFVGKNKHKRRVFRCLCDCGNVKTYTDSNLQNSTKSCGCLKKELITKTRKLEPGIKKQRKQERDRQYAAKRKKREPEKFLERARKRTQRYRCKHKKELAERHQKRMQTDPLYVLRKNVRNRFKQALKHNYKAGSAVELLGISIEEFKVYMESLFLPGMTWKNYGKWHIDHIYPLSAGDLTDLNFLKVVCNYKNLQPLWAFDNISKHNKIIMDKST